MATNDRRVRLALVAVAAIAVVIAIAVTTRGRGRRPPPPSAEAPTADPWATGTGAPAPAAGPRHLQDANWGFLKMRPAGPPVVVTGIVRLAPGGTAVAGAEVAFMNDTGENTTIADDSGRYTIQVASGIWWKIHARTDTAVGYPETYVPAGAAPIRDLEVHATARVRGKVIDARGAAAPGAEVSIFVDPATRGLLESAMPLSTLADDAGRFELSALPGPVTIKGAQGLTQGVGLVSMLAPGETVEVEVRLNDPITVTGHVVDADGQPVASAKILAAATISPGGPTEKLQFDSAADGGFSFVTPAGWLRLEAKRGSERSAASAQWINGGGRLDGVTLTIAEPVALRGKIITPDGTPVGGAKVRLVANAVYDAISRADGTFEAAAIPGQAYTVKVKHSDGAVQREVAAWNDEETFVMRPFGGLRVRTAGATGEITVSIDSFLPVGEAAPRVPAEVRFRGTADQVELTSLEPGVYDLTISTKGAGAARVPRVAVADGVTRDLAVKLEAPTVVRGVVKTSGQPVAGAQITLGARTVFTDGKGRWSIGDVASGPVAIVAVKQGFGNAWVSAVAGDTAGPVEIELRPASGSAGAVDGIGVVLAPAATGAVIASVLPGSPADGKLAAGDLIEEVDGTDVGAAAIADIVARLRGSAGSSVSITVRRPAGSADSSTVELVRKRLAVPQGSPAIAIATRHRRGPRPAGGRRC